MDPSDPDMAELQQHGPHSGNPTTYEAIRTRTALYVEYVDGEREYYYLAAEPDELHNAFASLSEVVKASLHQTVDAMQHCRGAQQCRTAAQVR